MGGLESKPRGLRVVHFGWIPSFYRCNFFLCWMKRCTNLMVSLHDVNQVLMKHAPPLQQTSSRQDGPGSIRFCSSTKSHEQLIHHAQDRQPTRYELVTFFDEWLHGELVGGFFHRCAEGRDVLLLPQDVGGRIHCLNLSYMRLFKTPGENNKRLIFYTIRLVSRS